MNTGRFGVVRSACAARDQPAVDGSLDREFKSADGCTPCDILGKEPRFFVSAFR